MPRHFQTCSIHTPPRSLLTQNPYRNARGQQFTQSFTPFKLVSQLEQPTVDRSVFDQQKMISKRRSSKFIPHGLTTETRENPTGLLGLRPTGLGLRQAKPGVRPAKRELGPTGFGPGSLKFPLAVGGEWWDGSRKPRLAEKLRWRNAFWIYRQLDLWNQGYIDICDAADRLHKTPKINLSHLERLVSILEDLRPHVSSRGVVEKDVAVRAIKRAIDESGLSCPVYGPLRGSGSAILSAQRSDAMDQFGLIGRPFYRSAYTPSGVEQHIDDDAEGCRRGLPPGEGWNISPQELCRPLMKGRTRGRVVPEGVWGPIDASLEVHSRISKIRRERRVEDIQKKQEEKERAACSFKPDVAKTLGKDVAKAEEWELPKREVQRQTEKDLSAALTLVAPLYVPLCHEAPSDGRRRYRNEEKEELKSELAGEPLEFQRFDAKQRLEEKENVIKETPHFVFHLGESPALKAVPWEESLRSDWERRVFNTQMSSDATEGIIQQFDAFSVKVDGSNLQRGLFVTGPNWTPKMAFEGVREERKKTVPPTEDFFPCPHSFIAPYQGYNSRSRRSSLPAVSDSRSQRMSYDISEQKQGRELRRSIGTGSDLPPQAPSKVQGSFGTRGPLSKEAQMTESERNVDALLLSQNVSPIESTRTMQDSVCGELASGMVHPNRGHSDWVYNLRK